VNNRESETKTTCTTVFQDENSVVSLCAFLLKILVKNIIYNHETMTLVG